MTAAAVGHEEVDCNQYSTQGGDEGTVRQIQAGYMAQVGINDFNTNESIIDKGTVTRVSAIPFGFFLLRRKCLKLSLHDLCNLYLKESLLVNK